MVTEQQILETLSSIQDPDLGRDIVTLGFVKDVVISEGNVAFTIELTTPACPVKDQLKADAQYLVSKLPGVTSVMIEMTAQVRGQRITGQELVPGVKHVIAIASGKGGVGKSTVSVNIAVALGMMGAKVGLLDADIYGPSLPMMMGVKHRPDMMQTDKGPRIVPIDAHGVKMMSLGFLVEEGKAVIWRGPMVAGTVRQLLGDVEWGELDYLIVDLPPGTGDAPLTLAQQVPLSGVVIVMTPQQVAQEIAYKSILMFRTLSQGMGRVIPILGIVENMSGGIFGSGGGEQAAIKQGTPFLGTIPLDAIVSQCGDSGQPAVRVAPESQQGRAFQEIARALAARISTLQYLEDESEEQH